jgi:hypothetical protein
VLYILRHNDVFPLATNFMCDFSKYMWVNGWLDEFSGEHFLIKTIKNEFDSIEKIRAFPQLNNNNFNIYDHSTSFCSNFVINFSCKMEYLNNIFGEDKIKKFVVDQLSAGKVNYNEDQFFRALTEIEILKYFGTFGYSILIKAVYEPAVGENGKNPEARFYLQMMYLWTLK